MRRRRGSERSPGKPVFRKVQHRHACPGALLATFSENGGSRRYGAAAHLLGTSKRNDSRQEGTLRPRPVQTQRRPAAGTRGRAVRAGGRYGDAKTDPKSVTGSMPGMTARRAHATCSHPEKHPFSRLQQACAVWPQRSACWRRAGLCSAAGKKKPASPGRRSEGLFCGGGAPWRMPPQGYTVRLTSSSPFPCSNGLRRDAGARPDPARPFQA